MNMNFKLKIVASFMLLIFFCGGCSTLDKHGCFDCDIRHDGTSGVYRGTQQDLTAIFRPKYVLGPVPPDPDFPITHGDEVLAVSCGLIDFPFSLTADTIIFPYDLTTIAKANAQLVSVKERLINCLNEIDPTIIPALRGGETTFKLEFPESKFYQLRELLSEDGSNVYCVSASDSPGMIDSAGEKMDIWVIVLKPELAQ
jgi:uncharacterized protein YceK